MTTSSLSLPLVPASPTPFTINIDWDSSVASAPNGFTSDILAAVKFLETEFTNPVTITISVGYGEIAGAALDHLDVGESMANMVGVTYASLLKAVTASDSLPPVSPVNPASYWVTSAQAKALGLTPAGGSAVDGSIGFGPAALFTYGLTDTSGTVARGTFDFFAAAVHEITEVMGRQLLTGSSENNIANSYTLLDLLHYSAPGTRDFSATTRGYLSPDGGTTNLGWFNTVAHGDPGDWAASVTADAFDAFASMGVTEPVTANDLTEMDAIGWRPAGVAFTAALQDLTQIQGLGGLLAGSRVAKVTDAGTGTGDEFSYALGGPAAGSFKLAATKDGAVLMTGPDQVAGTTGGALYALTVTATDQTLAGKPTTVAPVNIVVGGGGNDTIALASLAGIAPSAPTFVYGLGGSDTINGTGMTGMLVFDGGAGADTMTGGSGENIYEFGARDSTASVLDIITNFNAAVDRIDLTRPGWPFNGIAALSPSATTIAADAIGWRTGGGNTFVYANTSDRIETLTAASKTIELRGDIALAGNNFIHS